jgi:predicted DNA-binding transcriptional regulator YafY
MEQELIDAINAKKVVEFTYGGHPRVTEPHVLGVSDDVVQLLGYQIGGSSSSGGIPEWRRFDLSKISGLRTTQQTFPGKRPFPSRKHSTWDRHIAIVS